MFCDSDLQVTTIHLSKREGALNSASSIKASFSFSYANQMSSFPISSFTYVGGILKNSIRFYGMTSRFPRRQ